MSVIKCKGTVLQHTISASLVDIAQLISLTHSGSKSLTFDSTTLDSGVAKLKAQTGYSDSGTVSAELFYDPALAGHQFFGDLITAPADNAMKIKYADAAVTQQSFTVASVAFGVTVAMDDGLKGSVEYEVDGDPGWPT